jgi:hypothetical protein
MPFGKYQGRALRDGADEYLDWLTSIDLRPRRRAPARRYHPDVGGSHEQMIRVTAVADWLRALIEGRAA